MECTYFQKYEEKILTEGIRRQSIEIAKKLKKDNIYSEKDIAEITELDLKTVEEL